MSNGSLADLLFKPETLPGWKERLSLALDVARGILYLHQEWYMAPEWHKNTLISTKVDIYSFGVVLLEILCCTGDMKIDISCDDKISFFTWVYGCFVAMELKSLVGNEEVDIHMFEKMVKVGLLCIQDDPEARPSIKDVILMVEGTTDIPIPPSPVPSLI
ncbi:putative protein kinase RLK-Pelle-SD-2b family [Helianthus anomalus]